jgi:hypothetical protein
VSPAAPFEIAPWVQAAVGVRDDAAGVRAIPSVGAGVEGTFRAGWGAMGGDCARPGHCSSLRLRVGPWVGIERPVDRLRVEGGAALDLGSPNAVAWSTFGLRAGIERDRGSA